MEADTVASHIVCKDLGAESPQTVDMSCSMLQQSRTAIVSASFKAC